jgi:hypothetical protein
MAGTISFGVKARSATDWRWPQTMNARHSNLNRSKLSGRASQTIGDFRVFRVFRGFNNIPSIAAPPRRIESCAFVVQLKFSGLISF